MTQPDGDIPDSAIASLSAFAAKTQEDWDDDIRGKTTVPYTKFAGGWGGLLSGILGAGNNALNAITQIGTLIWKVGGSIIDDVGDFINAAISNAGTALANAGLSLANVEGLIQGFFTALTGQSGATSYVDPVEALTYLADQVSGTAQAVAQLQAANAGSGNSGLSGGDNFQTASTGGPPPGWTAASSNGTTSYVDTSTGKAQWHNAGNANPTLMWRRTATADAKTITEFQRVTITVATPVGGTNSQVRAYGRMSDDGLHYVVAYVANSTVYIAYTTTGLAGEVIVDSGPLPTGQKMGNGAVLSLECGTTEGQNEYDVRLGGVNAQSYTDTGNLITTSVNYAARGLSEAPRGWAIGWRPGLNLGSWYRPATLSGCTIADNIPAEIKGHGFRVYRESTTSSGALSIGDSLAPFYDEIDYISPGSAWSSAGYTIPKAGMWCFNYRMRRDSGNWTACGIGLHINGVGKVSGEAAPSINITDGTLLYYCEKGDVVAPYVNLASGTVAMNGSSSGLDSYFAGALMSS